MEYRNRMRNNFQRVREAVTHILTIKLEFTQSIPFKICVLAHHNEEVARNHCRLCVEQARRAGIEQHADQEAHVIIG